MTRIAHILTWSALWFGAGLLIAASCYNLIAQPIMPMVVEDYGPDLPEPIPAFVQHVGWEKYPTTNNMVLVLRITNVATNYTKTIPVLQTNTSFIASFGTNNISLTASNTVQKLESTPATLTGSFVIDRYQKLNAQASTNILGPWKDVPLETMTNTVGYVFLKTYIKNWTSTNWVQQ